MQYSTKIWYHLKKNILTNMCQKNGMIFNIVHTSKMGTYVYIMLT